MEKKNVVFLTIIAVATLLTAVIGATFAYFSVSVGGTGNTTNNESTVTTAIIAGVNYEGTSVATSPTDGAYPGWKDIQTFTIEVPAGTPTDAKGTYTITLTPNVPADFGTDITYEVYKTTDTTTDTITRTAGTITNTVDPGTGESQISRDDTITVTGFTDPGEIVSTAQTLAGTSAIQLEEVDYDGTLQKTTYFIVYRYANTSVSQNAAMGQSFSAKVNVSVKIK